MTNSANSTRHIVMTASCRMPTTCWGRYGKVAVVRLEEGFEGIPKMISERARGVEEIVELWDRQHNGSTTRCAFSRALAEAEKLCDELNSR